MNVLEISDEELGAMHDAAMEAFAAARLEIDRVVGLREEKARLVALKQAFGPPPEITDTACLISIKPEVVGV
jgi:hypothetical protein